MPTAGVSIPTRTVPCFLLPQSGNKKQEFGLLGCKRNPRWYHVAAKRQQKTRIWLIGLQAQPKLENILRAVRVELGGTSRKKACILRGNSI
jgi:hypothetical protein